MTLQDAPKANVQMLIRKPVEEVFEAFVDPTVTTKFWFTKSSDRLGPGKRIRWDWELNSASAQVVVKAVEKNQRLEIEWSGNGVSTSVEWLFTQCNDGTTLVHISNWDFEGSDDEKVARAIDSKGGFTLVLAGLKALLEHKLILNLVGDQYPDAYQ